jgi:hypothetical protein
LTIARDSREKYELCHTLEFERRKPRGRDGIWVWASGYNGDIKRAAYGYEPTREAAMTAFAKGRRRE